MITKEIYPKTELVVVNSAKSYQEIIAKNQFTFPLIVKPAIGCRGVGVKQVNNSAELIDYEKKSRSNFLI